MIVVLIFICCWNVQTAFSQGLSKYYSHLLHCLNSQKIIFLAEVLTKTPIPKNVTEGSRVQFHCATLYANVIVSLIVPGVTTEEVTENGGQTTSVTFTATAERNGTDVVCLAGGEFTGGYIESTARLLVQGDVRNEEHQNTQSTDFS